MLFDVEGVSESVSEAEFQPRHWVMGGFDPNSLALVTKDVVVIHNRSHIKFIFLRSGRSRCLDPKSNRGLDTIGAHDELEVLAWSDGGPLPNVHVLQYGRPTEISTLPGCAQMEIIDLAFNRDQYLLGLSGIPDFKIILWDWKSNTLLFSQAIVGSHGPRTRVSFSAGVTKGSSTTVLLSHAETHSLSVWKIKRIGAEQSIFKHVTTNPDVEHLLSHVVAFCWHHLDRLIILNRDGDIIEYDVFKNKLKTLPLNGVALTGLVSENDPQKIRLFPHFQGLIVFKEQRVCSLRSSGGGLTLHLEHSLPEPCGNLNLVQEMSTNCSFVAISEKANFILVQTSESNISSQIVASGPLHFCLFTQAAFLSPNLEHLITIDTNKIFRCHSMGTRSLIFEHTLPSRSSLLCQGAPSELFIMDQNGGVCHFSMLVHERGQTRGAIQSIQPINENGVDLAAHNQSDQTRAVLANCSDGQLFLVQFHPQHPYLEVKAHLEIGHKLCDLSFRSNTLVALIGCKGHWAKHVALIQVEFDELVLKNVVAGSSLISGSCLDEGETSFFSISRTEPPEMVKVSMEHGTISIIPETDPSPTNPTNRQQDQQSPARGIELIGTSLIVFGLNGMVSFYNYFEGQLSLERKLCLFSNLESIVTFHHVPSPNLICGINSLGGLHVLQLISGSEGSADIEAGTLNISESPLSFQPSRLAELQAQALEKTQMPHRDTLHDISSGLQGIKEQVEILLRENEALPPANQVDRHDFELDLEEKQAIEHKGFEQEHELQLELQAHCIARSQIKGRIRLQIWDPMEVKGKTIEGIKSKLLFVSNYPLMARTRAELSELAKIISERKFARKQADLSARLVQAREIRDPPESPLPIGMLTDCSSASLNLASPRQCSMDNVSHSAGGGSFWDEDGGGSLFPRIRSSSMSPAVDSGVITPQLEILTHLQAQQHVILLRNHIRQLKARFNRSFDQLHDKKSQMMTDIMKWCQELEQVTGENGFHEEGTVKSSLHWSLREHPESAFETVDPQESVNSLNAKGPNRSDRGGSFDVAKDICPPEFQAKTKSVAFTPAQQSQVEEFCEQLIARNRHEKGETRNQSNTRILLSRRIEDSIGTYECSLKQLYEDKLQVQKQVHTEELKILLHVRRMAEMERWSSQETEFRQQIANAQMERDGALKQVEMGQLAIADNKTLLAELSDNDKLLEKNFKKSFQGINYNQIEALLAAFRRRPKAGSSIEKTIAIFAKKDTKHPKLISIMGPKEAHDLRSKSIASTLEKMCQMFLGPAATNRGGSASSLAAVQALTLEEMDRASHCPENVSGETWLIVCQLRRKKIASEERIADIVAQLADTEEFVEEGSKWHEQAVQDLQFASSEFEAWRIRRNTEINESEMLLTFHRGQVELMLDAFDPFLTDGALLTDDVITKLNKEIDKSVVSRSRATRDIKEFQRGSKMLQWERDKLLFNLEDLKSKWCDIQQTKLPREGRNAFELLSKKGTTATNELYSSMTDEYARLDQLSQKTGRYLSNKLDQLDHESKVISENASGKSAENEQLILEIKALEEVVEKTSSDLQTEVAIPPDDKRLSRVMKRTRLVQKIKEQNQLMIHLRDQLETYMFSSFPSLG